jgi:hypothetical protein
MLAEFKKKTGLGILVLIQAFLLSACGFSTLQSTSDLASQGQSPLRTTASVSGGNASISANVFGSPLVISTSGRFAGAINSLTWNGKQFLNSNDHGREMQSASSFDGLGECWNPTEAGSEKDGLGNSSTSRLLGINASGNQLQTTTQMAFWTSVGGSYPNGCGGNTAITVAQNKTNLSNDTLDKKVTIGFNGLQNVIEYLVTFHVTDNHSSAAFEAVTGYMPPEFSSFWIFDPATVTLTSGNSIMHALYDFHYFQQTLPVILSTGDQQYAMGIYSPDLPIAGYTNPYGYFNFPGTTKWTAVYEQGNTPAGSYSFRNYVVVGTLQEVQDGMTALYKNFHPNSPAPTSTSAKEQAAAAQAQAQTAAQAAAVAAYQQAQAAVLAQAQAVAAAQAQAAQQVASSQPVAAAAIANCQYGPNPVGGCYSYTDAQYVAGVAFVTSFSSLQIAKNSNVTGASLQPYIEACNQSRANAQNWGVDVNAWSCN